MRLEDQVVSLELAKKLRELGVKQDSYAFWMTAADKNYSVFIEPAFAVRKLYDNASPVYSAFTVAELGEMLPQIINAPAWQGSIDFPAKDARSKFWLYSVPALRKIEVDVSGTFADTEADARAKMLVYLIENGLMEKNLRYT